MASASIPSGEAIAVPQNSLDPRSARLPKLVAGLRWLKYLSDQRETIDAKPQRHAHRRLTAQGADIATTALPIGSVTPGLWGIHTQLRVSRVGSVSLEVQLTVTWTQNGVTQSESGTNLTGNLTTTREGRLFLIRPDNATPISYSVAYTDGGGATPGQFELDLVAVQLAED